ncbi:MAG: TIGR01244 family phosphatase, partial [Pseudomonadales bacterium]|nr:TIGR01244 family phosphatase [Pseudomonadales bacterium]
AYHHQPVISGAMTEHDVIAFRQLLASAAQPVLAFCRSGTRCTTLWAFASAGELAADDIIGAAARAGYDLSGLRDRL